MLNANPITLMPIVLVLFGFYFMYLFKEFTNVNIKTWNWTLDLVDFVKSCTEFASTSNLIVKNNN